MEFFRGIRKKTGYYVLKRQIRSLSRERVFLNLADVRSIGVLFMKTDNKDFEVVQSFVRSLREDGKDVFAIGYVEAREIPDFYLLRRGFNFFCMHDLNWFYRPEPVFVSDFINREFDLLINLSIDNPFPLDFIYALSKARFKAGMLTDGYGHSDLAIDIKEKKDIEYLIQQLTHYLYIINKKQ